MTRSCSALTATSQLASCAAMPVCVCVPVFVQVFKPQHGHDGLTVRRTVKKDTLIK